MHEVLNDADRYTRQIGEPFLEERVARGGPEVAHLERFELKRLLGGEMVLANQLGDATDEVLVLEHQQLGIEDARLVHTSAGLGAGAQLIELLAHILERRPQPPHLLFDLGARDHAMRDLGQRPADRHRRPHRDAGRDADAFQQPVGGTHASSFSLACGFRCIS